MNKKAQGISMNVIIIAAIALLVLVILSVIFIGRMGRFGEQTGGCAQQGGKCYGNDVGCGEGEIPFDAKCAAEDQMCCIRVGI